ncbi:hypothetical protein ASE00_15600 [Sphingomonas sp. Root710]|nr:hypothetical protein ASE00_15600 [Sphingomonas sp. Root710]
MLYYADIHAPEVTKLRAIKRNYSAAGTSKVLAIAAGLNENGYSVRIISPASVCERAGGIHPRHHEVVERRRHPTSIVSVSNIDNRLLRPFWSFCAVAAELWTTLRHARPDLVIVYNLSLESLLIGISARLKNIPVVLEYEDSATTFRTGRGWRLKSVFRLYEIIFGFLADMVFAPSETLARTVKSQRSLHIAGVLGGDITKDRAFSRTDDAGPAPGRGVRLIYAGGIDRSKGIVDFVRTLDQVDRKIELDIYGGGPEVSALEDAIRGSRHRVRFHGMVPRSELLLAMCSADMAIDPHHPEMHAGGSWPFKVIEYLGTCGTVLTSSYRDAPADIRPHLFPLDVLDRKVCAEQIAAYVDQAEALAHSREQRIAAAHQLYSAASVASRILDLVRRRV